MQLLPASLRLFACLPVWALLFACQNPNPAPWEVLWYPQPAGEWVDALPLGNGRLGVMVFGDTAIERIQLNDDSMWPADSEDWNEPAGTPEDLAAIRQLLLAGDHAAADALFVDKFSRKRVVRSHQTLGDLFIEYQHQQISDYRRELDLSQAVSRVEYLTEGKRFSQETFVSHPHRAIVMRLSTEKADGINARIRLSRPEDNGFPTARAFTDAEGRLHLAGEVTQREGAFDSKPSPLLHGVQFESVLNVQTEGGEVVAGDDYLELKGGQQATLYLVSNSSYYEADFTAKNQQDLSVLSQVDYASLKAAHIADYRSYYDRCQLQLGESRLDSLPTDQRLQRVRDGQTDPALEALLFQYGRYLLISSSRPGTNPANLQGLWNPHIKAPWNADYHLNINLQMNYWLADVTHLGDLNQPLFDFVDRLVENGQQTARQNFGCEGSFLPHATDLWAPTWLRAPTAYWGCSVGAAGWMMQHYWQHYAFTLDQQFLAERAMPAIEQVARFYSDWLVLDPRDSLLVSAPSTSPENRFLDAQGEPVASCLGSAMDQQIIREVFDHYLQGCDILGIESPLRDKIAHQLAQLRPGFVLGQDGRILEWDREYPEHEPGHRHMSHLYGFHPGNQVSAEKDPAIFEAVRKTLDY
ncbi:MAG: glycoside hydrolase family 95 protein, partial [Bacteroidetes bacterium]